MVLTVYPVRAPGLLMATSSTSLQVATWPDRTVSPTLTNFTLICGVGVVGRKGRDYLPFHSNFQC